MFRGKWLLIHVIPGSNRIGPRFYIKYVYRTLIRSHSVDIVLPAASAKLLRHSTIENQFKFVYQLFDIALPVRFHRKKYRYVLFFHALSEKNW